MAKNGWFIQNRKLEEGKGNQVLGWRLRVGGWWEKCWEEPQVLSETSLRFVTSLHSINPFKRNFSIKAAPAHRKAHPGLHRG